MDVIQMARTSLASIALLSCTWFGAVPQCATAGERPVGKLRWKFHVGYRAYLAATEGVIYAASPTGCTDYVPCGPPARLFALDGKTGRQKWVLEDVGDDSAPVIADGVVYQSGGSLYAVNAETGRVEWSLKPTSGWVMHSPAIAGGTIIFWEVQALIPLGFFGGTLRAVDLKTRIEKWRFSIDRGIVSSPVAADGMIFVATIPGDPSMFGGCLYALDALTGQARWEFGVAGAAPAVSGGLVYYAGRDGILYVLYAQTGKKVWQFGNASAMASVNVVGKGLVYVMSYEQICAIDPKTRRQTWQVKTNTNGSASTVANGVVYVGSPNKHLYALSAKSGREIWKLKMSDYVVSNPVLANGTLYVASSEGYVYAVK